MISFVICSIDAGKFNAMKQNIAQAMDPAPYEIVGVHDAKSLCEGYNRGTKVATLSVWSMTIARLPIRDSACQA